MISLNQRDWLGSLKRILNGMELVGMHEALRVVSAVIVHPLFCSMDLVSKTCFHLRCQMRLKHVEAW